MNRDKRAELIEFYRYYEKALGSRNIDDRFDALMNKIPPPPASHPDSDHEEIELLYQPYTEPFAGDHPWAAAKEPYKEEAIRFCSRDGRFLLREFQDSISKHRTFHLVGESRHGTGEVEIIIDGTSLFPDKSGMLEIDPNGPGIKKDSKILIKRHLPS
ncbi:MAG: hypothetical protein JW814_02480 [Candidatus Krumholzibacteriota bacterium]|nr:hypothetical protein [Candidatus Krumholzibacteriota bacterium]